MKLMDVIAAKHPCLKNTNGHQTRVTKEMAAEIKKTYAEKGSLRATAKHHNCCVKTVKNARDGKYDNNENRRG